MKKTFISAVVFLCLVQTGIAQTIVNRDSLALEKMFDQFFRDYIAQNPEDGSQLGLSREMGCDFDRSRLNDISPAGLKANIDLMKRYLDQLHKIKQNRLTPQQKIDADILKWQLTMLVRGDKYRDHKYAVDHLSGIQIQMISLLTDYHPIESLPDAEDYLSRMEKIPAKMDQVLQALDRQEGKGIYAPVFIAERVIGSITEIISAEPQNNLLYGDLKSKLSSAKIIDQVRIPALCQRAEQILRDSIYPAYQKLKSRVQESKPRTDSRAGLGKLPDGDGYYEYCLMNNTTLSMSPEEVHRLGLAEVKILQQRCRVLLDSLGIRGDKSYGQLMEEYWGYLEKPEIKNNISYPQADYGKRMVIRDYQALIDTAYLLLPQAFSYIPQTRVEAQPVPPYKEKSGLTYYEAAPLDGRRKAVFYVNLTYLPDKPDMVPLTFHETVPGHHYQIALQQELCRNRMFRNLFFLSGFGEGWAMYAQDLAFELGWLPDIHSRIAEINSQLFRAVRIVLDTGIHLKQWNKEQSLAYMKDNLGWASKNEIDRYVVWPGQACSYTLGKIKIKQLREKAKAKMGSRFDLKEFHRIVLENGSMPLDILDKKVEAYIKGSL